jgi:hypothetical protein
MRPSLLNLQHLDVLGRDYAWKYALEEDSVNLGMSRDRPTVRQTDHRDATTNGHRTLVVWQRTLSARSFLAAPCQHSAVFLD